MRYRISFLALLAGLVLAVPTPSVATEPSEQESPSEMAREGMQRMLEALENLIESIPQYEMPEITDEGDIIIRRKPDPGRGKTEPKPEIEETAA